MSDQIVRKGQTGEAGNAGEFGTHARTEDDIDLNDYVAANMRARSIALRNVEVGSAAAAARIIATYNSDAAYFRPIFEEIEPGVPFTIGVELFDSDKKPIEQIIDDGTDQPYGEPPRLNDQQESIRAKVSSMGTNHLISWWSMQFGIHHNGRNLVDTAKAAAWVPPAED